MPIPADDCANNKMSVDVNPSDTKSDLETTTKMNGDGLQKINGTAHDDAKEADEASEIVVKEEVTDVKSEILEADKVDETRKEEKEVTETEAKEIELEKKTESKSTDELVKNGISEPSEDDKSQNNIKVVYEKNSDKNDNSNNTVDHDKTEDSTTKDNEEVKPMEVDETESVTNVIIKKELEEPKMEENAETQVVEKLDNGDAILSNEVMKNGEDVNPVNGDGNNLDTEKSIKSEKVGLKVPEEEDILSEISVDTLSPKQVFIKL